MTTAFDDDFAVVDGFVHQAGEFGAGLGVSAFDYGCSLHDSCTDCVMEYATAKIDDAQDDDKK